MARIRTIKPELFTSASMAQVSVQARYVLVGLLTEADDDGRFLASSKRLAGVLFPHDEWIAAESVEEWLKELEAVGTIELYEVNGVRYGVLPGFACHQRIAPTKYRASTLPEPVSAGQRDGRHMADTWQPDGRHVSANPRREREVEVEVEREGEREVEKIKSAAEPRAEVVPMFTDRSLYFVDRLAERDPDAWKSFGIPALVKLGKKYGPATVAEALSYAYEERDTAVESGYPLVEAICRRLAAEREESA